ncbi:MAG: TolC family protein [Chthonomonadales bacterium]|nr:TolC family protein [Chthonomonadales bacterium]
MRRRRTAASVIALAATLSAPAWGQAGQIQTTPTTRPGSTPPPMRLTLDEAVAHALASSKTLATAAEAVQRARGVVGEARSAGSPALNSNVTFTHLDQGSSFSIQTDPNSPPVTVPIVRQNQKAIDVSAVLPIDIAGQIGAAVQAAQFQEIATRLDYNRARNQLVLDVKSGYYDLLRARAFVDVAEQALRNAQDRVTTAEATLRAGTGTRFDVLRAQTDVANAQQTLISARNAVNLATATLNNLLSLDQNTPIQTVEATGAPTEPAASTFDAAVAEAYQTRPEVYQADAQIRAAERGVVLAQRSVVPTLGVSWAFQYSPDAGGFAPKETSWAAVARLSLPLFDGGLAKARTREARADVNTARIAKQQTLDAVALDVRQNYLALAEAQERLNVADAALTQAEEQYRLAQVRFKAGVTAVPGGSPLLEISDAQTALTQAQTNQVNARYDVQNARARLDRAVGRYAFNGAAAPGLPAPADGGNQ